MTQKKQPSDVPNKVYSDEFCRGESIQAFGIDLKRFVYHQVRYHFKRHCSIHNITMEHLATMVNVPLERLQAFYELGHTLSLQEWIEITDVLGYKDYFAVGRKEKNKLIKKNSSLRILTDLVKKAQFDISLQEYAWMLDSLQFGKFAIILFPLIPRESAAELRKKRKPIQSKTLRRYYEN